MMQTALIRTSLLNWFQAQARDLPWRHDSTPYRVWVSEIMLQQTRVDTVIPYYQRFMTELPTLQALAEVPEEKLLKLWEGLGYYRRARNLQKTARLIVDRHHGIFPDRLETLLTLPGIGEYTAAAIASIAFEQPAPAIDGNVLRVICRLTENRGDPRAAGTILKVRKVLKELYPSKHCGDFTQSLMELGALVCLPNGRPDCDHCPLAAFCQAFQHDTMLQIPVKAAKKKRRIEKKTVLLLLQGGKIALRRRPGNGLLAGLWEFPMLPGWPAQAEVEKYLHEAGFDCSSIVETIRARHIFSHLEWHMRSWQAAGISRNTDLDWFTPGQIHRELTLPTAFQAFRKLIPCS